ncbi:MAG: 16S rRNA (cytosine(967)-C(5))-methyltransferase RsmB [Lachnospiraceae bacterium]|nr:16S rRNA (cytosine(967)-C(5))-methyltransferase RsmB [Lachnospiraceae bacterium]
MDKTNIRSLIVDSLVSMERDGIYLSAMEQAVLNKYDYLDMRDKAFYKKVMDGTNELRIRIDYIIDIFSSKPVTRLKPVIRAIMRMSVYQLMYMDSVPDSAVCNEAVKLVSSRGLSGLKGYVNGTLRNISRNKNDIRYLEKKEDLLRYLSVYYSCPDTIVKLFIGQYGEERTENILASYLKDGALSIRLRFSSNIDEELVTKWKESGIEVYDNPHIPYARKLIHAGSVSSLYGYEEGRFIVQDTGSMMVSELAGLKPDDIVIDVCAAPGGKSIHAADILCKLKAEAGEDAGTCGKTQVYAYDISEDRCERIRENITRLGLGNMISTGSHDATEFMPDMESTADVVIADVPCSGLGVLGHKSDIKYRFSEADTDSLVQLQRRIIDNAIRYVKPGGKLVYSTCTCNRKENEEQVRYLIERYSLTDITATALEKSAITAPKTLDILSCFTVDDPGLTILPDVWDSDGFYICVLSKE